MTQIEIGDTLQLSPSVRLRFLGEKLARREDLKAGAWVESGHATLTDAQIAAWHARKAG